MSAPLAAPDVGIGFWGVWAKHGAAVIASADFTAAASAGGVFTSPPSWLSISCATTGRTVQTSASTVVSGIGANAWRARNVGSGQGLSVESSRTNNSLGTDGLAERVAFDGSSTFVSGPGPDGSSNTGMAITWTGGAGQGYSTVYDATNITTSSTVCWSWWQKSPSSTAIDIVDMADVQWVQIGVPVSSTWTRATKIVSSAPLEQWMGWGHSSSSPTPSGSANIWGLQSEFACNYPSSYVPNHSTSTTITRAADVLSTTAAIAPSGRLNMSTTIAPNFAKTEQGVDAPILWWDANDQVFLRKSDAKIVVAVGGSVVLTSAALTWSREQGLTAACHLAPGGVLSLTVSGATSGNGTTTASGVAAFTTSPTAYLLGSSSGAAECIDLRQIAFYVP